MRKSAIVCISFIASLMFSHYFGMTLGFALCLLLVLGVLVLLIKKKSPAFIAAVACAFLIGNVTMGCIDARFESLRNSFDGGSYDCRIRISEVLRYGRAYAKVESIEGIGQGAYFNVLCYLDEEHPFKKGDLVDARLSMQTIYDTGSFPTRLYNESKGTVLSAAVTDARLVSSSPIWSFHSRITDGIGNIFDKYLGEYADLSKALLLGGGSELPDEYNDMFSSLGIIHILSVSGMHFGILIGVFTELMKKLRLGKIATRTVIAAFSLFYMFITGFSPSVCRAGIMSFFVIFDFVARRRPDKLTTLCIAGALMCLANPVIAFNISFQLSFLATFGLVAASNCLTLPLSDATEGKVLGKAVNSILISVAFSFCAMFFCLAPIAHSFQSMSLLSPVSNLICAPLAELLLIGSFVLLPLALLPHIAFFMGKLCQLIADIFMDLCRLVNNESFVLSLQSDVLIYASAVLTAFTVLLFLVPFAKKKEALLVFCTGSALLSLISL